MRIKTSLLKLTALPFLIRFRRCVVGSNVSLDSSGITNVLGTADGSAKMVSLPLMEKDFFIFFSRLALTATLSGSTVFLIGLDSGFPARPSMECVLRNLDFLLRSSSLISRRAFSISSSTSVGLVFLFFFRFFFFSISDSAASSASSESCDRLETKCSISSVVIP